VAENANGAEKTEEPTPKRLQDARDEGQTPHSPEVNTATILLVAFCVMLGTGTWFVQATAEILRQTITDQLTRDIDSITSVQLLVLQMVPMAGPAGVVILTCFVAAAVAGIGQVGFHLAAKALVPKFSKVNPLTGFTRLFGLRALMKFVFNVLKLAIIATIGYLVLNAEIPRLAYIDLDIEKRLAHDTALMIWLGIKLVVVLAFIAAADLFYQRYQHLRDMMMTKDEVKQEMKQSDGDPQLKGRIRQIQREMAQKRMMQEVPKADVVITNPTHVAVALKYDQLKMAAPVVVAKGYDEVAQRIKAIAKEHNITMVENVPLARALAKDVEIGKPVPTKLYQAVAEVLAMVFKLKKMKGLSLIHI
jgi:flagellar biosynthetic protein FlhB